MKQYLIDELRPDDHRRLKAYLDEHTEKSPVEGLYWLPLADASLTEVQAGHEGCRPFYFALELEPDRLACELLVRTQQRVRCDCIAYATPSQRNDLIERIDAIFEHLGIMT